MFLLIVFVFGFFLLSWLSYYTSASVYKSLKENNKYARAIQVVVFLGMFIVLMAVLAYFIFSNVRLER